MQVMEIYSHPTTSQTKWHIEKTWEHCTYWYVVIAITYKGKVHHRCGYVLVPKHHEYYRKELSEILKRSDCPQVHKGITYASTGNNNFPLANMKDSWWIGFHCNHEGDVIITENKYECYPQLYVECEAERLIRALIAIQKG